MEGFNGPCEVTVVDYSARKCAVSKKMKMLADFVLILTEEVVMFQRTVENMINMVTPETLLLTTDLQYGTIDTERIDATTDHGLFDLPPVDFHYGLLWDEFQHGALISPRRGWPRIILKISVRTTVFVICLLMYSYIRRLIKTLSRQFVQKGVKIKLRRNRELRRHRGAAGIRRNDTTNKLKPLSQGSKVSR